MQKRALLFLNGENSSKKLISKFLDKTDFIVCADGGAEHAVALGLVPNIIIGDFDSISAQTRKKLQKHGTQFIKYPVKKNFTDSELAIDYLFQQKFSEVVVFGLIGDRLDHLLSNIFVFAKFAKKVRISIITNKQKLYFVTDQIVIKGKKGDFISLLALTPKVSGLSSINLKYALSNATLNFGTSLGISNELTSSAAKISIKSGVLFVVQSR